MERNLEAAQQNIGDHEQTIVKFRDLVAKLQVRLEGLQLIILINSCFCKVEGL